MGSSVSSNRLLKVSGTCSFPRRCRSVTSIGYAAWGAQVSVGASPSRAEVEGAIQRSNDARFVGDAPSANSSGDGNGTLVRSGISAYLKNSGILHSFARLVWCSVQEEFRR